MPKTLKRRPARRAWRHQARCGRRSSRSCRFGSRTRCAATTRADHRRAIDALFFRLRTGCQWNALLATGLCSSSSVHRRFQEWRAAGVFLDPWRRGLTGIGS